jgi:hypothetical protein
MPKAAVVRTWSRRCCGCSKLGLVPINAVPARDSPGFLRNRQSLIREFPTLETCIGLFSPIAIRPIQDQRTARMGQSIRDTTTVALIGSPRLRMRKCLRSPTTPDKACTAFVRV